MTQSTLRNIAITAALTALVACGGEPKQEESRPIELAPAKQEPPPLVDAPPAAPVREPVVRTVSRRPAPSPEMQRVPVKQPEPPAVVPTPLPTPVAVAPAPFPTTGVVDAGTLFSVKPAAKICTNTHKTGDHFSATLAAPLKGTNGVEIPEGAIATMRIVDGSRETRTDSAHLTYEIVSIRSGEQTYEVNAHVTQSAPIDRVKTQSNEQAAVKVGAGAVIGAIAGRVIGGNTKGAVIGGAVGAAAGAAVAVKDHKVEGCLQGDGSITLALDKPLTIRLAQAP